MDVHSKMTMYVTSTMTSPITKTAKTSKSRSTLNILVISYWNFSIMRQSHIIADLMAGFHMFTAIIVSKNVTRGHFVHHQSLFYVVVFLTKIENTQILVFQQLKIQKIVKNGFPTIFNRKSNIKQTLVELSRRVELAKFL